MEQSTMPLIYNILGINRKIPYQPLRIKYLRDVWGLEQTIIGECEDMSQSSVSKMLLEMKFIPKKDIDEVIELTEFAPDEIETLQRLPREMIKDVPLIAFVNNILVLNPHHSFYTGFAANMNIRIAALSSIGIQNKLLEKMFHKTQPSISMIIKRNTAQALNVERYQRYELNLPLTFSSLPYKQMGGIY